MKLRLKNGNSNYTSYINFSNGTDGFDIRIDYNPTPYSEEQSVYLTFRPWDDLAPFVSAVTDYSWSNGLMEVPDEDLAKMLDSFSEALERVQKEVDCRKGK